MSLQSNSTTAIAPPHRPHRIAMFSIAATLSAVWLILVCTGFAQQILASLSLQSALKQNSSIELLESAKAVAGEPDILLQSRRALGLSASTTSGRAIVRFTEIIIALKEDQIDRARALYLGTSVDFRSDLSEALKLSNYTPTAWWSLIETSFANLITGQAKLTELGQIGVNLATSIESLEKEARLLRNDLSEFFSLPLPDDDTPLIYYHDGLLKDLPMLPALDVELPDATSLKTELDRIGGKVRFEGPDAAITFQTELEELRSAAKDLHAQLLSQETAYAKNSEVIEQLNARLTDTKNSLLNGFEHGIQQLLRARLNIFGLSNLLS